MGILFAAVPQGAYAHCAGTNYLSIVIVAHDTSFTYPGGVFTSSTQQAWGAPWCYVYDRQQFYRNGAYVFGKYWRSYASVDSGVHASPRRSWSAYNMWGNGAYKVSTYGYRNSSHQQLWGTAGWLFGHCYDSSYKTMYLSIW